MSRHESVTFEGERAGPGALTWGQRAIWLAIRGRMPSDHDLNLGLVIRAPGRRAPITVPAATAALGMVISRHEALRTRLRGGDDDPAPVVARSGRLEVEIAEAAPEEAARTAERTLERLLATAFDYRAEWPLRVCLVTCAGAVTHVVLALCHLAADGHGAEILARDLRVAMLRGALPPGRAPQPREIAAWQRSAEGRRVGRAALEFWESEFRRIPPFELPHAGPPGGHPAGPPFRRAAIESPALDAVLPVIAARHRVSPATVLLAGWLALIAAHCGQRVVAIRPIVNNRFYAAHRDAVSTISQEGLVVVDTGAATFGELVRRTGRAALRAYRHARFDAAEVERALGRVQAERGPRVRSFGCFNDLRLVERPAAPAQAPRPDEGLVRAALGETRLTWPLSLDELSCWFCVHIGGEPGATAVSLTADTRLVAPDDMERFLYGLEALLVESAFREVAPAEIPQLRDRRPAHRSGT